MRRTRKTARNRARAARGNGIDPKNPYLISRTALRNCLTETDTSVRRAAKGMRKAPSTVQRYLAEGFDIPPLRSPRLAACFVNNLRLLIAVRNGKA